MNCDGTNVRTGVAVDAKEKNASWACCAKALGLWAIAALRSSQVTDLNGQCFNNTTRVLNAALRHRVLVAPPSHHDITQNT